MANGKSLLKKILSWPYSILIILIMAGLIGFAWYFCFYIPVTTVLIVRHAEKGTTPPNDPPLTTEPNGGGVGRAQTLARVVGDANVQAIYATQFARTQQTAQPTATRLGLPVTLINASETQALVNDIMSNHRGQTVLVVSHTPTIEDIIAALHGGQITPVAENEFDKLFVVTVYRWRRAKVVQLRYGNPTPPPASP